MLAVGSPSHRLKFLLLLVLLLVSATFIWARLKAPDSAPGQPEPNQLETEIVTITPTGFEPAQITRPQGRFMLAIDNRSGLDQVGLYLEREKEGRVNVAFSRKGKLAWRDTLDIPPGVYILRAANDESWRCTISITPR
jgi:hypothetical protein